MSNRDKNAVSSQSEELVAIREKWYSADVRVWCESQVRRSCPSGVRRWCPALVKGCVQKG